MIKRFNEFSINEKKTKMYVDWNAADDIFIQTCAKHLGYDEINDTFGNSIEANKLSKTQRDMLVKQLSKDGYVGADVTDLNWIVPVKKMDEVSEPFTKLPENTEAYINKNLKPIIDYCKSVIFTPEAQKSGKITDEQVLGIIVSKFCKWDGDKIIDVASYALEDSNFDDLAQEIKKL